MLLNVKSSSVDSIKEIHVLFTTPRDVTELVNMHGGDQVIQTSCSIRLQRYRLETQGPVTGKHSVYF